MDDSENTTELISALLQQGDEQTMLLRSIDAKLDDVIQGLATVADGVIG